MMKKQTKVLAVLSTAMLMAAAAPSFFTNASTAFAKSTGWTEENGSWHYLDSYGEPVTDTWKKHGEDWYYLDAEGVPATSMQIDEYYVGENGKRVTFTWISVENEEFWSEEDAPEKLYYYYGRDGKAITSKWASIGGQWYYFNEDSQMETGSIKVDGYNYYLGKDGSRKTGWILLPDENDDSEYTESWYYYDNSGKRVETAVDQKINGEYYTFVDGRMQTGWFKLPATGESTEATPSEAVSEEPTVDSYQYYDEDGKRAQGWRTIEGAEGISEEAEIYTFYFKKGEPYHAQKGLELFNIDSKKYSFNTKGEMQTGKQVVNLEDGGIANFYFGDDGIMKIGKQTILNEDSGETQNWYFHTEGSKKGQGFHGIKENVLYLYGLRQEADKDLRFAPAELNGKEYLINTNGAVQKASSNSKSTAKPELGSGFKDFKDENDTVWTVNTEGVIR